MKKYFLLLFLITSVLLPISAQTAEEVTVIEDSAATVVEEIDEANEIIIMADTMTMIADTIALQDMSKYLE